MIRIKKFNESQRFPTQVNSDEFMKKRSTHKMIDFSASERSKIREILYAKRLDYSFSSDFFEIHKRPSIEVIKLNDEWYTICQGVVTFYICDGFEELITYLKQL